MDIVRRKLALVTIGTLAKVHQYYFMAFYDKNAPTEKVTDVSPVGLGAILV